MSGNDQPNIVRLDHYTIKVDGILVTANEDQERRIREMTPEQLKNFKHIMGQGDQS